MRRLKYYKLLHSHVRTSISCVLHVTEVDVQCHKLANDVGQTSIVATTANASTVRPTMIVSLSHWASTFYRTKLTTRCDSRSAVFYDSSLEPSSRGK